MPALATPVVVDSIALTPKMTPSPAVAASTLRGQVVERIARLSRVLVLPAASRDPASSVNISLLSPTPRRRLGMLTRFPQTLVAKDGPSLSMALPASWFPVPPAPLGPRNFTFKIRTPGRRGLLLPSDPSVTTSTNKYLSGTITPPFITYPPTHWTFSCIALSSCDITDTLTVSLEPSNVHVTFFYVGRGIFSASCLLLSRACLDFVYVSFGFAIRFRIPPWMYSLLLLCC